MTMPEEYRGREQSYLKHRVLQEYLVSWGMKLGSVARRRSRLCYVDGFAGPWQSKHASLEDTSIAIGLRALATAVETWAANGLKIEVDAVFVEKDPDAFRALNEFLRARTPLSIKAEALPGEFGGHVEALKRRLGSDAGFVFIDPTGWKGAAMHYVAPLIDGPAPRDVLVNVMFDHLNRFKDDERAFIRAQMSEFFAIPEDEWQLGMTEDELFDVYRARLKEKCRLRYAADLAIPHPTDARTKFRLVVGGKHAKVLELFREIEQRVVGTEAAGVRDEAATRRTEERTGQVSLLSTAPALDHHYDAHHRRSLHEAPADLLEALRQGPRRFEEVWPPILERRHITKTELAGIAVGLAKKGALGVEGMGPRERSVKDHHRLYRPDRGAERP